MEEIIGSITAVIIALASLLGAWLKVKANAFAWPNYRKQKKALRRLLDEANGDLAWREVSMLARHIGESEETTRNLLLEIGARRSLSGRSSSYALERRRPIPPLKRADTPTR
ncbi:MAG: hypothetical protein NZ990_04170 [Myxococcota bacterium]|nr:hypothetical protein [Myxococcota bacterium]